MRLILLSLSIVVIAASAATLKPEVVENPQGYANAKSHAFARGDNGDGSGWRECAVMESNPENVGIVCEGTRSIERQQGQFMDVNYFCEFHFNRIDANWARVDDVLCL